MSVLDVNEVIYYDIHPYAMDKFRKNVQGSGAKLMQAGVSQLTYMRPSKGMMSVWEWSLY